MFTKAHLAALELRDGMVLSKDVFLRNGRLLAPRGYKVNRTLRLGPEPGSMVETKDLKNFTSQTVGNYKRSSCNNQLPSGGHTTRSADLRPQAGILDAGDDFFVQLACSPWIVDFDALVDVQKILPRLQRPDDLHGVSSS